MVGLVNLRALQLISFRTEDTCLSVMRETRQFIVDAVSYHPDLKLEYLALGDEDRAMRIVRKLESSKGPKKISFNGKEIATDVVSNHHFGIYFPEAPMGWYTVSESEDEEDDPLPGSKLEVIEGFAFYDIYGIRIFKKEIVSGRL